MIRVRLSELLSTIRPQPSIRCRSLSDGFRARTSGKSKGLKSSARSHEGASNIGFHRIVVLAARPLRTRRRWARSESGQALRAVVGNLRAGDLLERTVRL